MYLLKVKVHFFKDWNLERELNIQGTSQLHAHAGEDTGQSYWVGHRNPEKPKMW